MNALRLYFCAPFFNCAIRSLLARWLLPHRSLAACTSSPAVAAHLLLAKYGEWQGAEPNAARPSHGKH
jgi:hypothetical protein